jgi:hypothetical protein
MDYNLLSRIRISAEREVNKLLSSPHPSPHTILTIIKNYDHEIASAVCDGTCEN